MKIKIKKNKFLNIRIGNSWDNKGLGFVYDGINHKGILFMFFNWGITFSIDKR